MPAGHPCREGTKSICTENKERGTLWGNPIAGKHVGSALRPDRENCPEEIWASLVLLLPELPFPFSFLNVGVLGDLLNSRFLY